MIPFRQDATFVYLCEAPIGDGTMFVKVGISATPLQRIGQVAWGSPVDVRHARFVCVGSHKQALKVEAEVLREWADSKTRGEWLRVPVKKDTLQALMRSVSLSALKFGGRALAWRRVSVRDIADFTNESFQKSRRRA